MVKRVTVYASALVALVSIWLGLLALLQTGRIDGAKWSQIIFALPWFALISLGCYCLGKLGIDLLTFNDYPHEIKALEKDIVEAKADLKKRGFVSSSSSSS